MERRAAHIRNWTVGGILFGLLFPVAGWLLAGGGLTPAAIGDAHAAQSVLWIVDLAPFVLGAAGALIGHEYAGVRSALDATDRRVRERTAELQEANGRLEDLMRSKDRFVATVSHEVRNPLTVVLGFADELRDGLRKAGSADRAELAELIGDQSREINNIIEDLLVAARAEVGTMTIVPDLIDLAHEARTVVRSCVCTKEIRDSIILDLEEAPAWADATRVRQVIRNLLTNAVRYGGEEISLTVHTDEAGAKALVRDNGSGIPAEQRELVFAPYGQGSTSTPVSGSVGLGLSVSRQLARLMGGDLTYRYEQQGCSVFEFTLPVPALPEDPSPQAVDAAVS